MGHPPTITLPMALVGVFAAACLPLEERVPILLGEWCDDARAEQVACVIDGDTLDLGACGNDGERVRLLGIDAPEVAHDSEPAECYGDAATDVLDYLVEGELITMRFDTECTDIYDRTLGWISLDGDAEDPLVEDLLDLDGLGMNDDGSFSLLVNEYLLRVGAAILYEYDDTDSLRYGDRLIEAEAEAEADKLGLWSSCSEE